MTCSAKENQNVQDVFYEAAIAGLTRQERNILRQSGVLVDDEAAYEERLERASMPRGFPLQ